MKFKYVTCVIFIIQHVKCSHTTCELFMRHVKIVIGSTAKLFYICSDEIEQDPAWKKWGRWGYGKGYGGYGGGYGGYGRGGYHKGVY